MPVVITEELKGKELYFDLRTEETDQEEGFWAVPIFLSDKKDIDLEYTARGGGEGLWIEMLLFSVRRWTGFRSSNGKDIPCTAENIRRLCESNPTTMLNMLERIQSGEGLDVQRSLAN